MLIDCFRKRFITIREMFWSSSLSGTLSRNALGSLLVRIGASLLAFFVNIFLARFLGISEYGLFIYAVGWLNILLIPASLGLDKLLVRQIAIYQSHKEWSKLKGVYQFAVPRAVGMSIIVGLVLCGIVYFTSLPQPLASVFYLAALLIPVGTLIRIQQAGLQGLHAIALGQLPEFIIQPSILLMLVFISFYSMRQSLVASQVMILNVMAGILALVVGSRFLKRSLPEETLSVDTVLDRQNWTPSLVPLMMVGSVYILNDQLATILLGSLSDTAQVALFAAADKWTGFSVFMLAALNPALAPIFAKLYAQNEKKRLQRVVTFSTQIIALFALLPLLAFMTMPQIFLSTFGGDFSDGRIPLIVLGIGQFINAFTGSVGILLSMTGHERFVVKGVGLGVLVNLLLGILLIPYLGAVGAAIAGATSVIIINVLLSVLVFQKLNIFPTALGPVFAMLPRHKVAHSTYDMSSADEE